MAGMDDYLQDTGYTGDSSEGGGQHMSLDDQGEGFYGRVTGNQDKKFGDHDASKAAKQKGAAKGLMGGEKSALGGKGNTRLTNNALLGAKDGENGVASGTASDNATSGFANKVLGRGKNDGKAKGGFKGKMKKMMPMLLAAGGIGGFGAASFFGQLAMPFSLISQFQSNFNSSGVSSFLRTKKLTKFALDPALRTYDADTGKYIKKHSKIYQVFTGADQDYFHISSRQAKKLGKRGISVETDSSGVQVMKYKTSGGEELTITPRNIDDLYESNAEFRSAYYEGSKTWRQALRDWFDNTILKILTRLGIGRNHFKNFQATNDTADSDASFEQKVKTGSGNDSYEGGVAKGRVSDNTDEVEATHNDNIEGNEADLETYGSSGGHAGNDMTGFKRGQSVADTATAVKNLADKVANKMRGVGNLYKQLVNGACTVAEIASAISLLVIANEALQILKTAATIFSGIQKAQVEDSSTTPVHNIANDLTKPKESTYYISDTETETKTGSAMEAEGPVALYGNTAINSSDVSVKSFNLTDNLAKVMGAFNTTITTYKTCLIAKLVGGLVDAVADGIELVSWGASLVACLAGAAESFGASCGPLIGKFVAGIIKGIALSELISQAVGYVVQYLVPKIATMLARDLATNIGGEDFGNALVSGANMYMGKNHQGGGGATASKVSLIMYLKVKEEYIADIGRHERETRSPFDATSPYTFMGNLLSRSIPILVGNSSIISSITNITTVTGKALTSLIPGASAMTAAVTAQTAADETSRNCPELDSVGAVGDSYCNPYRITDFDLIEEDPATIVYEVCKMEMDSNGGNSRNFVGDPKCDGSGKEETVPEISQKLGYGDDSSRLMEYIVYCGQRDAPLGMADTQIAGQIDSGAAPAVSSIPVWGGLADVAQNTHIIDRLGYVTGEACVIKDDTDAVGSKAFKWSEAKYYQRFVEDQRYLEASGLVKESAVTIALNKYYEEHPIDTSYEGVMARMTGMSKEKVIATEKMIDLFMWLADYKPDGYFPYHYEEPEEEQIAIEDDDIIDLEEYDIIDDSSWKYMNRMEYTIS